jgi:hypothetical protein
MDPGDDDIPEFLRSLLGLSRPHAAYGSALSPLTAIREELSAIPRCGSTAG